MPLDPPVRNTPRKLSRRKNRSDWLDGVVSAEITASLAATSAARRIRSLATFSFYAQFKRKSV
jgi:hypothetical protein